MCLVRIFGLLWAKYSSCVSLCIWLCLCLFYLLCYFPLQVVECGLTLSLNYWQSIKYSQTYTKFVLALYNLYSVKLLFQVLKEKAEDLKQRPGSGCYITGLFLEGARWGYSLHELTESRPKELYTEMPVMWLKPCPNRVKPTSGIYECPVYKTLTRAGRFLWQNCVIFFRVGLFMARSIL